VYKYLQNEVPGYPQTPIDERVQKLRTMMTDVVEYDARQAVLGDLVLLDEYRDKMVENVAAGRVPGVTDAGELKKIVDARATMLRLPKELGMAEEDIYEQIKRRIAGTSDEVAATDFTIIEEQATEDAVEDLAAV